jgi:hypothetical protein
MCDFVAGLLQAGMSRYAHRCCHVSQKKDRAPERPDQRAKVEGVNLCRRCVKAFSKPSPHSAVLCDATKVRSKTTVHHAKQAFEANESAITPSLSKPALRACQALHAQAKA